MIFYPGSTKLTYGSRLTSQSPISDRFHAHQGIEFYYIHEGRGKMMINRRLIEFGPGTLFIFQPYQMHKLLLQSQEFVRSYMLMEPTSFISAAAPFPQLSKFLTYLWKTDLDHPYVIGLHEHHSLVIQLTELPVLLDHTKENTQGEEQQLAILSFLHKLRHYWQTTTDAARQVHVPRPLTHTEQILDWLEYHYTEPFELQRLADALHLSPKHLSTLFRQSTGETLTSYITTRRLKDACLQLQSTTKSVAIIGDEAGFPHTSYFIRTFKQEYGVTPLQFRRSFQ
ncbi:helix-turn-helix domain-containing protein [Paenibacillus swuensis]|uniref:helix-turn-helix domain-containing protein n=1 Tax=Paenibacillus swuensis TaxID=1178515 RepID=UPI00083977F3|nr:helix-turn-helix domain-containing protein [Paenibacillus swuensis]